jgi:UDPglucose--hexose-1-phosphate uridylyltransferase
VPEIRIDPLSGHKTIVAGERSRRPGGAPGLSEQERAPEPIDRESDPFADGHEDRTPPELYALRPPGGAPNSPGWTVRVVRNLYPALTAPEELDGEQAHSEPDGGAHPELFSSMPATGAHEVIVNGPQPVLSLAELPVEQVLVAMDVWRERMRVHAGSPYVQLIVNERRQAGASLPHTHAQLYALDFVPATVARERERAGAYATRMMGQNLLGDLVGAEVRLRERIVAIDEEAVLMTPYASRLPFQLMLAPRRPRPRFEEDGPTGAALLHDGLRRLTRHLGASPPLNLWVRTAPRGTDHFCWRIDVLPRLTHIAGLELSTDLNLNIVAPEHAATLLREARLPTHASRATIRPPLRRRARAGGAALRPLAGAPVGGVPGGRRDARHCAGGRGRGGRDPVVSGSHVARAHLRSRNLADDERL